MSSAAYHIEEVAGTKYATLEEYQDTIILQLARLIAEAIRSADELPPALSCGKIGEKETSEDNDDV